MALKSANAKKKNLMGQKSMLAGRMGSRLNESSADREDNLYQSRLDQDQQPGNYSYLPSITAAYRSRQQLEEPEFAKTGSNKAKRIKVASVNAPATRNPALLMANNRRLR